MKKLKNKKNILILAPHPDDETLGCGGTIFKHINEGSNVFWVIFTRLNLKNNYFKTREKEILKVEKIYKFKKTFKLNFETSKLDKYSRTEIINKMKKIILKCKPSLIYCPFFNDAHSDHRIVNESMTHFAKSFRYPFIKEIRLYETISETDNSIISNNRGSFNPNLWIDITKYLKKKIKVFETYKSEIRAFPFPRSKKSIISLSNLRGSTINKKSAESFMVIKKVID